MECYYGEVEYFDSTLRNFPNVQVVSQLEIGFFRHALDLLAVQFESEFQLPPNNDRW